MSRGAKRDGNLAAREAALQMLYAHALAKQDLQQIEGWYLDAHPLPPALRRQASGLLAAAAAEEVRIEAMIRRHAIGWRLERISLIDRSVLTLAIAELLHAPAESHGTIIQMAKRLAARFSQPEAVNFIHGLLAAVARELAASAPSTS